MSKMKKSETQIEENELKLDALIIETIVLYKPVATDLRRLFAISIRPDILKMKNGNDLYH